MASLYGQVKGQAESRASRTGSKRSHIIASAQSYKGSLIVEMSLFEENGVEKPFVNLAVSDESDFVGKTMFMGSLDLLCERLTGKEVAEFLEEE